MSSPTCSFKSISALNLWAADGCLGGETETPISPNYPLRSVVALI